MIEGIKKYVSIGMTKITMEEVLENSLEECESIIDRGCHLPIKTLYDGKNLIENEYSSLSFKKDEKKINGGVNKKAKEKWLQIPTDIWFYILNEYFTPLDNYIHLEQNFNRCRCVKNYSKIAQSVNRTKHLLHLSQVCKSFHSLLLNSEIIMKNVRFTLKLNFKLSDIINECKPSYKIRNLSLAHHPSFTNTVHEIETESCFVDFEDLKIVLKSLTNVKYFDLCKLDISFCNKLSDDCFDYFKNVEVLEMGLCDQKIITNKALLKLKQLKELKMIGCDQNTINEEAFATFGKNLRKLDISQCHQFTNKLFNYLTSNCEINKIGLNIAKEDKKRKLNKMN